ncbi:MAG: homoserine kinase [Jatrophihabitans sp.]
MNAAPSPGAAPIGRRATVRVPASSANLGPGFDALGLALCLHDEASAQFATETWIEVSGAGTDTVPRDESHLVLRALRRGLAVSGESERGVHLRCHNAIPHGRGLGSSAAAICAGLLLARALADPNGERLDDAALLALAAQMEGHPDNVAACLLGGLTVAWTTGGTTGATRLRVHPDISPVVLIPADESSTEVARGLLPESVPHADAAFNAARAALLIAALTADPAQLLTATEDRLHQPYRAGSMPATAELVAGLRDDGLAAVVSGAGPTVLVLCRSLAEVARASAAPGTGWRVRALPVDVSGARVLGLEEVTT